MIFIYINYLRPPLESTVPAEWNLISEINKKKVELLVCEKSQQFEVNLSFIQLLFLNF